MSDKVDFETVKYMELRVQAARIAAKEIYTDIKKIYTEVDHLGLPPNKKEAVLAIAMRVKLQAGSIMAMSDQPVDVNNKLDTPIEIQRRQATRSAAQSIRLHAMDVQLFTLQPSNVRQEKSCALESTLKIERLAAAIMAMCDKDCNTKDVGKQESEQEAA